MIAMLTPSESTALQSKSFGSRLFSPKKSIILSRVTENDEQNSINIVSHIKSMRKTAQNRLKESSKLRRKEKTKNFYLALSQIKDDEFETLDGIKGIIEKINNFNKPQIDRKDTHHSFGAKLWNRVKGNSPDSTTIQKKTRESKQR